jgi:hypothetical protein
MAFLGISTFLGPKKTAARKAGKAEKRAARRAAKSQRQAQRQSVKHARISTREKKHALKFSPEAIAARAQTTQKLIGEAAALGSAALGLDVDSYDDGGSAGAPYTPPDPEGPPIALIGGAALVVVVLVVVLATSGKGKK